MGRLIYDDKLKDELKTLPMMSNWGEVFVSSLIDEQPTAYDIDKVVEEVKHIIAVEFDWLRVSIFEKEYIDLSKIDVAERALRTKVVEAIKAGEQSDK